MTKSQRLKPVIKVSETREQDAARALAESKRILSERQAKLADLNIYREEYNARFNALGGKAIPAIKVNEFRVFLANLNAAIACQEKMIENRQREFEDKLRIWYQVRGRVKALNGIVERYHQGEMRTENQREQSAEDERACRTNKNGRDT